VRILLALVALSLGACTSLPPKPLPPQACSDVAADCDVAHPKAKHAGLSADQTVQLMVNSPMLIGGKPADASEWPASVYARSGGSACSATIVGERTVFMAAHCMSNGGTVSFTAHANAYKARCAHHPEYRGNDTADWALCLTDRPVTGVPFELLGPGAPLALKQVLLLSGYGCVKPGGGGGNDGVFRIGQASVTSLPSGKNYDIVTRGGAALCFGDSGGAAYNLSADGKRVIVGVNSRGNISNTSYLPAVKSQSFVSWALQWAADSANTKVCGLHSDAMGCRGNEGGPLPDGKFEIAGKPACLKGVVSKEYLDRKQELVDTLKKALDQF
jgi:hypothetical protein